MNESMPRNTFKFYIPLEKDATDSDTLNGIASTVSVDRDSERMSHEALSEMVNDIKTMGINLFGNHEHSWENTLGVIKEATLIGDQVHVKILLDDETTNSKIPMLKNKLRRGINLGLSVGGKVTEDKLEYNKELGRKIKVINRVKLFEVSVVGIPSNADAFISLPDAISKSMKKSITDEQIVDAANRWYKEGASYSRIAERLTSWTGTKYSEMDVSEMIDMKSMKKGKEDMCVCGHDARDHDAATSQMPCHECNCNKFRPKTEKSISKSQGECQSCGAIAELYSIETTRGEKKRVCRACKEDMLPAEKSEDKKWKCPTCGKKFDSEDEMERHIDDEETKKSANPSEEELIAYAKEEAIDDWMFRELEKKIRGGEINTYDEVLFEIRQMAHQDERKSTSKSLYTNKCPLCSYTLKNFKCEQCYYKFTPRIRIQKMAPINKCPVCSEGAEIVKSEGIGRSTVLQCMTCGHRFDHDPFAKSVSEELKNKIAQQRYGVPFDGLTAAEQDEVETAAVQEEGKASETQMSY